MTGSTDLNDLLAEASPLLDAESYVFVSVTGSYGDFAELQPLASFSEREGLTLVLRRQAAEVHGLSFDGVFRRITLQVHSSLAAIGLTAAVSGRLAAAGICANVVAAYHHDHIFVHAVDADRAMAALLALAVSQ